SLRTLPGSNGNITIQFVSGNNASIIADGSGTVQTVVGGQIQAKVLSLSTDSGAIGSLANPVSTSTSFLSVNSVAGNIDISNQGNLVLQSSSLGLGSFLSRLSVSTTGTHAVQGVINAYNAGQVQLTSQNDSLFLNANINGYSVMLTAENNIASSVV